MSAIDILILAVVVTGGVIGFTRGIVSQVGSIAAVVAGIVAARVAGDAISGVVGGDDSPALDAVAGYGIAFLGGYVLAWVVARVLRKTVHGLHLGIVDRLGGAIFKVLQWGLVLSLALNIYIVADPGARAQIVRDGNPLRSAAVSFAPAVLGYLSDMTNINAIRDVNNDINTSEDE